MTYFCPSLKRPSPCFQYVPTTVVVRIRQPSQNIHTFCQRFRSPYVFWSSSSLLVDETAEVVLPSPTSTEFDSNWVYSRLCVCVCVFSSHPFWTSSSLDVPAGVTQEEGHTGFLIHLPSAVRALIFVARRIQPLFLSLVDREVEFCVLTN